MNYFPRRSQFQGHLITTLPNLCLCAECHSVLIYACGDETETVTCAKEQGHTGLVDRKDVVIEPIILTFTQQQRALGIRSLFGDE